MPSSSAYTTNSPSLAIPANANPQIESAHVNGDEEVAQANSVSPTSVCSIEHYRPQATEADYKSATVLYETFANVADAGLGVMDMSFHFTYEMKWHQTHVSFFRLFWKLCGRFLCVLKLLYKVQAEVEDGAIKFKLEERPTRRSVMHLKSSFRQALRLYEGFMKPLEFMAMSEVTQRFQAMMNGKIVYAYEIENTLCYVKETSRRGKGLFAKQDIKKNKIVANYMENVSLYFTGQQTDSLLFLGNTSAHVIETLLPKVQHYAMQVKESNERFFDDLWTKFSVNRDYKAVRKTPEVKEVLKKKLFSDEFIYFMNMMLLNRAYPDRFVAPTRPEEFTGIFFELFVMTHIISVIKCIGATVIPCDVFQEKLRVPSKRLANYCNTANRGDKQEKNVCEFQFNKINGSIALLSVCKIKAGEEILVKYGKHFSFDVRPTDEVLSFLQNCRDSTKKVLMKLVGAFERSRLFPQKEDVFQALRECLTVVETPPPTPVPTAVPTPVPEVQDAEEEAPDAMINRLILLYHKNEWWPCVVMRRLKGNKKTFSVLILRTDLPIVEGHCRHFAHTWDSIELGPDITEFMKDPENSPASAIAYMEDQKIHEKNPFCSLKSTIWDLDDQVPTHVNAKEIKSQLARNKKRLHLFFEQLRKETDPLLSIKEQMRLCHEKIMSSHFNLNKLLGLVDDTIENANNLTTFTPEMIEEELPYYYNHNGKWCSVVGIEEQRGKIIVTTETLCEQQKKSLFAYDDVVEFISEASKLHDREELFLRGEASPPVLCELIMKNRRKNRSSEAGPSERKKKRKRGRPRKNRSSEAGPSASSADDDLQAARLLKRLRTEEEEEVCTCDPVYEYHCRLHRCARA